MSLRCVKIRQHYFPICAGEERKKDQDLSFFSLRRCVVNKGTLAWRDEEGFLGMLKMKKGKSRSGDRGNESRIPLFSSFAVWGDNTQRRRRKEEGACRCRRRSPLAPKNRRQSCHIANIFSLKNLLLFLFLNSDIPTLGIFKAVFLDK